MQLSAQFGFNSNVLKTRIASAEKSKKILMNLPPGIASVALIL